MHFSGRVIIAPLVISLVLALLLITETGAVPMPFPMEEMEGEFPMFEGFREGRAWGPWTSSVSSKGARGRFNF
ncbi:unnamed protein product [Allacma fusca]|uniref:Uncharacterized protein n=1 Tax=Allacma fusca TaxID=39272 RepID=A0A8J2LAZ5_9HEXA|nr:unnamed protein product [Allacma fusca]